MPGPLDGVRVVDLTTILLGPMATQIMGDLGADVIKVESPEGDAVRAVGPPPAEGMGAVFLGVNRNKRGLVLDLKQPSGREAMLRLCATADVFVHNMRPAAAERIGVGYEPVAAARPDIVYCGTYGFRADGPYGERPAYDDMIQAASGLAALQGRGGDPAYAPSVIADKVTGLTVVYAVLAALFHRARTGEGQRVEVPMFESMVAFNAAEHLYGGAYDPPRGPCGYPRALSANRRPYATRDGFIGVLPYTDRQWRALLEVGGRADLAADPRFASLETRLAHIDEVYAELASLLATRTTAEWLEDLTAANVPAMPVNRPDDLLDDAHLEAVGFWRFVDDADLGRLRSAGPPTRFFATPAEVRRRAPRLGEHSREVLADIGYREAEIEALLASGATAEP